MGKADDFLNSDEALEVAQAADAATQAGQAQVDPGLQAQPAEIPAAEAPVFDPLGKGVEHPTFAGLDQAAAQYDAAQAAAQAAAAGGQVAAAATPEQQAQAAAAIQAALRDRAVNELGLTGLADATDDWDAFQRALQFGQQQQQQAYQLGQQLQQMQAQLDLMTRMQQTQPQASSAVQAAAPATATPAAAAQPASTWPKRPEWEDHWEQFLIRDPETGRIVVDPKSGAAPDLAQKYTAYKAWERKTLDRIASDPQGFARESGLFAPLEEQYKSQVQTLREEILGDLRKEIQAQQQFNFGQQFAAQHGDWMYQKDMAGRPIIDPRTNQPALTNDGQQLLEYTKALSTRQLTPQEAMQIAFRLVSGQGSVAEAAANELHQAMNGLGGQQLQPAQAQQPAAQLTPEQIAAQRQQATNNGFLARANANQQATRQPQRSGAPAVGTPAVLSRYAAIEDPEQRVSAMLADAFNNPAMLQAFEANAA